MAFQNQLLCGTRAAILAHVNGEPAELLQYPFEGRTDLDFGILFAIVSGEDFSFDRHELLPLEADCPAETVFPLPESFIAAIAQSNENTRETWAQAWAAEDEIDAPPTQLLPHIEALYHMSQQRTENQEIHFNINW